MRCHPPQGRTCTHIIKFAPMFYTRVKPPPWLTFATRKIRPSCPSYPFSGFILFLQNLFFGAMLSVLERFDPISTISPGLISHREGAGVLTSGVLASGSHKLSLLLCTYIIL